MAGNLGLSEITKEITMLGTIAGIAFLIIISRVICSKAYKLLRPTQEILKEIEAVQEYEKFKLRND